MPRIRNFAGVQFEDVRRVVDPAYNTLHDQLEDCYYGDVVVEHPELQGTPTHRKGRRYANGWVSGVSKPFVTGARTYDVQATPRLSKELFDKLHAYIWLMRQADMVAVNIRLGTPYDMDQLDEPERDEQEQPTGTRTSDRMAAQQAALDAEGITIERPTV